MFQYILNATAIWLISLASFDVFLRRESYHNYNRVYLLVTFLLGAFVPLIQWQDVSRPFNAALEQPIEKVITAKQNIVEASPALINWQQALMVAYLIGVLVALCMLVAEIIKLSAYYHAGKRSYQNDWTVIETGKEHAPFSFRNVLYVSSVRQYTPDEWDIILLHEKQHYSLLHFADLLLIQIAKVVFWFHPLVYVYNKRLLLVHEYQADHSSATQPQVYGRFLVEQALLQAAPSISHSFNRSPIKNRIIMLTRRSSFTAKSKMLVFVPVALVCVACFSKNSFAQKFEKNGDFVTYRGNKFEMSKPLYDTVFMTNPTTGEQMTKVSKLDARPIKMNGKPIVQDADKEPYFTGNEKNFRNYLLKSMKDELEKLDDGQYTLGISNIVVDENGKVVYFDYANMRRSKTMDEVKSMPKSKPAANSATMGNVKIVMDGKPATVSINTAPGYFEEVKQPLQDMIFQAACRAIDKCPEFLPAKADGKNVTYVMQDMMITFNHFRVKDHKLYDKDKDGAYVPL